ncbi:DUF3619 family protein [Nitrosomonas sp.]|uniref:DUF3619 family protein n=1 Tax=Nitrosomonas sp. TaxID=42353 RepID=UPI0025E4FD6B|nr:DUF3619 family protein [Nitrosomonas sp.]MCC6916263.1 DUF3619 family protein [Nitrosomonas sp.]
MMTEEERTGKTVKGLLDKSLGDITPGTLYRLQAARRAALEQYQPAGEVLHTGTDTLVQSGLHWISSHAGRLLLTASLLFFLATHSYWQKQHRIEDKTTTAPAILTQDAPSGAPKTNDTADMYTPSDEVANEVTAGEAAPRDSDDEGGHANEAVSGVGTETGDTGDSDDSGEADSVDNAGDTSNAGTYDSAENQDSLNQEETGSTDDYAPGADDTVDFYDEENTPDTPDTTGTNQSNTDSTDHAGDTSDTPR